MNETNIAKLNISIGLKINDETAYMCLRLLEKYLNDNEDKALYIYCDECKNWILGFVSRKLVKCKEGKQK